MSDEDMIDGGPAFPRPTGHSQSNITKKQNNPQQGMSLRSYFAGQALVGLLACSEVSLPTRTEYAKRAFQYADEMLKVMNNG